MANKIKGLTIELALESSKLKKEIKETSAQFNKISKELRDVERALKFKPTSMELLKQKSKLARDQVEATRAKLQGLKTAQSQMSAAFRNTEAGAREYRRLNREILKTEDQLKRFEKSYRGAKFDASALGRVAQSLKQLGAQLTNFGRRMAPISAAAAGVIFASKKAFDAVDEGMDNVTKATGASGDALLSLQDSVRKIGRTFPASFGQIGLAVGEVNTQFSLTGDSLENTSRQFLKFGKITGQDVVSAVQGVKKVISSFGLSAEDTSAVLDVFAKTAQNTGVSTAELMNAVTASAPVMKDLGLSVADTAGLLGKLQQNGLDSSKVITAMQRAQVNLAKSGKTLKDGLLELQQTIRKGGDDQQAFNQAVELFGARSAAIMVSALKDGRLAFDDLATGATSASGTVDETYKNIQSFTDGLTVTKNNMQELGDTFFTTFGEMMTPVLESLNARLQAFVEWFKNLPEPVKKVIAGVTAFVAALAPVALVLGKIISIGGTLLAGIGKLVTGISLVVGAIASSPAAIVASVAAAAAGVIYLIVTHWDQIKEWATGAFLAVKNWLNKLYKAVSNTVQKSAQWVKDRLSGTGQWLTDNIVKPAQNLGGQVSEALANLRDSIVRKFQELRDWITNFAKTLFSSVVERAQAIVKPIADTFEKVKNLIGGAFDKAKNAVSGAFNSIKEKITGFRPPPVKTPDIIMGTITYPNLVIPNGARHTPSYSKSRTRYNSAGKYDKGGIFDRPSLITVGEKRPEIVGALDDFRKIVREEAGTRRRAGGGVTVNVSSLVVREQADVGRIARELKRLSDRELRGQGVIA